MIYNDQVIQIEYPSLYYSWSCRGKCIDSGLCNSSEREKISRWRSPSVPKYELLKACVFEWTVYTYNAHIGHTWVSADFIPPLSTIGLLLNETRNNGGGWYAGVTWSDSDVPVGPKFNIFFTALIHSLQRKGSSCSKYCVYLLSTTHIWPGCSSYKAEYQFKRRPNLLLATNVATLFPLRIQSMCYVSEHGFWQSCTNLCTSHYELIRRNIMHDTLRDQMQLDGS